MYQHHISPQLNLIERLWRFVRNECLYSKYYADFSDFKSAICRWRQRFAIANCIATANTDHKEKLDTLLALNFQYEQKSQGLSRLKYSCPTVASAFGKFRLLSAIQGEKSLIFPLITAFHG